MSRVVMVIDDMAALQRELDLRTAQLEDTQARLEELLYVASHDLTEPLRMISSFLGLLERHNSADLDDRGREFVAFAAAGAERLQALVDDLLRYSRVDHEVQDLHDDVDLACVVGEVLQGLQRLIDSEAATVVVDGTLPHVRCDPAQVSVVLQNLIANAAKFHPCDRGNHVVLSAERDELIGGWAIAVSDDGIGVPDRERERIFAPFQRLHGREEFDGNGIGLAIARRIARRHGGDVRVAPVAAGGTTFTLTLPDRGPGSTP